ncbi:MAG: hypothetical protein C4567_18195 [Deltaproteobacteria bacterium]|nr:MAG: hypothetical protein C4567_18195 [Deltaproteobacteria bacterium]
MPKFCKTLLPLGVYLILAALVFHRDLSVGFLCDDVYAIDLSLRPWLSYEEGSYQFLGPAFAVNYTLFRLFHLNPLPYHVFHLFWVVVNAALTKALAETLGLKPWQAWAAGLLALFNSVAAEAIFWYAVFPTVMMTTSVLMGLLCLARFRLTGSGIWKWAYLGLALFAPLMESKGVILPLLGYLLDRWWGVPDASTWKSRIFSGWRLHFAAFGVMGSTLLLRAGLGIRSYVIDMPPYEKFKTFMATLVNTFFHGVDDHISPFLGGIPYVPVYYALLLVLLALLLWALIISPAAERRRLSILILAWWAASLPHTLAANVQPRYFYLPGVFAALVLVELWESFSRKARNPRMAYVLVGLILSGYLAMDLRGFRYSLDSYQEASRIYDAGIRFIKERAPVLTPDTRLLLIDFPDYIYSRQGQRRIRKYYALLYRNALPSHLRLLYAAEKLDVSLVRLSAPSRDNPVPLGKPATPAEVKEMLAQPRTLAIQYLPNPPRFVEVPETPGD